MLKLRSVILFWNAFLGIIRLVERLNSLFPIFVMILKTI